MTTDNDVDPAINGGHRQRRPLDGSIGFVGLGRMGSAMAANLAADLNVAAALVNIKATTTERLGFIGRQEGLAAMASVLLSG